MPGEKEDINDGWFVGQPLTVIYDVKKLGIWQTADSLDGKLQAQTSPAQLPGNIKVQDISGPNGKPDGKIDANDRQIIGNFQPKWEGGFSSRMTFRNFDFSFVAFARMGMKVLVPYLTTDGTANGYDFFMQSRINQLKVNYWTRSNPTNDFPAAGCQPSILPVCFDAGLPERFIHKDEEHQPGLYDPGEGVEQGGDHLVKDLCHGAESLYHLFSFREGRLWA